MPNNPSTYLDNSVVGFDPQDNLKLQVDTYNRLSPILNLEDKPMFTGNEPSTLHNNFQTQQQPSAAEGLKGMSIADAIDSKDPNIQSMGRKAFEEDMQKNVPGYAQGFGAGVETPYEQGSKYLNKKFGFSALRDNEDFYYNNVYMDSTWVGRNLIQNPLRFLGRVAAETITKMGEGLGYMGSMITSIGSSNYFEKVADNGFSKWFQDQEDWVKNKLIPVYKQAGFDEKGMFEKLGDWSFWNDDVADAAAFMTSFALQTVLTGNVGELVGLGKFGSLGINTASKLGRAGKVIDFTTKFLTGANDVTGIGNWAFNTASESFFESAGVFKETKQDLLNDRKQGKNDYTDEEINTMSGKRAAYDFKGNLMALTLSNAFENKFIFQPLRKYLRGTGGTSPGPESAFDEELSFGKTKVRVAPFSADKEASIAAAQEEYKYSTKLGKYTDYKNPKSRLQFYGKRAVQAAVIEGLYEENIQLAMERLSRYGNYDDKNFGQKLQATAEQLRKQTGDAFVEGKDREAAASIFLGALIGIGGTGIISKFFGGEHFGQGERRTEISRAKQAIDQYNTLRKEWLSVNDIYKDGTFDIDEDKVKAKAAGLSAALKKAVLPDQIANPVSRKLVQDDILSDFVHASRAAGLDGALIKRLENLGMKSPEEITALGFNPAEITSTPEEMAKNVKDLVQLHKESFNSTVTRPKNVSAKEYADNEQERKYWLYKMKSKAWAATNAFRTVDDAIVGENMEHPFDVDSDPGVQLHNSLQIQLASLDQFNKTVGKNTPFYDTHTRQRRAMLTARIKELEESLQPKIDDGTLQKDGPLLYSPERRKDIITGDLDNINQQQHATSQNAMEFYKYTAEKLGSLLHGYKNFEDWKLYQESIEAKDAAADAKEEQPQHTVKTNEDGTYNVVSPEGTVDETKYFSQAEAEAEAQKRSAPPEDLPDGAEEKEIKELPPPAIIVKEEDVDIDPPEEKLDVATQLEEKAIETLIPGDEVLETDLDKPLVWTHPGFTSKHDTTDVPGTKKQEEVISTDQYSLMRADFIKEFVAPDFNSKYRLFIVKDTFPQVYREQEKLVRQNEKGEWQFIDPLQATEVLVLEYADGTRAKVGDFKFKKDYKQFAEEPLVFSMDLVRFFNKDYDTRVEIKSERKKITYTEADEENRKERDENNEARRQIKDGEKDRIQVQMMHFTGGIHPKTKEYVPVQERMGNFTFEVVLPTVAKGTTSDQFGGKYPPGTVVAKIGKVNFPVSTASLSSHTTILEKIKTFLKYEYPTKEDAKNVRDNMLSILVGTNANQFFTVDKKGEKFVINFRRARPEDIANNEDRKVVRRNGTPSNDSIGDAKLNVSEEAIRKGYKDFQTPAEEGELLTREDYIAFIKSKLVTNLKKITNPDGSLNMEPVNPYFSFIVQSSKEATVVVQKNNYEALKKRIKDKASSEDYNILQITEGISTELAKGYITQKQFDELNTLAEASIPTASAATESATEANDRMLAEGSITPEMHALFAKVASKNKKAAPAPAKIVVTKEQLVANLWTQVEYKNTQGEISTRTLSDVVVKGGDLIEAWDSKRKERRTFNVSSILKVLNNATKPAPELEAKIADIKKRQQQEIKEYIDDGGEYDDDYGARTHKINDKYEAEIEALTNTEAKPEVVKEDLPPIIPQQKKNLADIYKNQQKQDVAKVIAGETQDTSTVIYKVANYLYIPEQNKYVYVSSGKLIPQAKMAEILEKMHAQFPFKESSTGDTGFNRLDVGGYTIYIPPTRTANAALVIGENGIVNAAILPKQLSVDDNIKAQEFLQKWCK